MPKTLSSLTLALTLTLPATLIAQAAGPAGAAGGTGATAPTAPSGIAQSAAAPSGQSGQSAAQAYAASAAAAADPRQPAPAKPGALTLAQIVDLAKTRNPTLLAAEQTLRSVRAQELQAQVRANPTFTLYGTNVTLPGDGSEGNPYGYSAQVSRLFERGQKRRWRIDDAKATTAQTSSQLEDNIRTTILSVKTAFTHMLIARQAALISAASLKDFQHEVDIASDRFKAGDLGKLDFERLDLQLGSYESDQANDLIAYQQASAQLQTLVGIDAPKPDFEITGDIVPPTVTQTREALSASALTARPDLAAARFGVQAADANARLAAANGTTDPTLEGEYDRSGDYNSAGFSVSIPLRLFDRNQGNKDTARYQADASRFTEAAARNQVVSDVEQAWVGYTQSKRLSDRFTAHYLDESRDVLSIAQFAFEHGGIALIDYLDALRDARSSTSDALNAYSNTWLAIHQLAAASGTEVAP